MVVDDHKDLLEYLRSTLGLEVSIKNTSKANSLPFIIRNAYALFEIRILGHRYHLFEEIQKGQTSPAILHKHLRLVEDKTGLRGIFCANSLESFNRLRLIERKIPFIIPGNQLYLPDLGIDLREQLRKIKMKRSNLRPSAQQLLFAYLLDYPRIENWTATGLSKEMGMSKMTMSRAIDELVGYEVIEVIADGREKVVQFNADRKVLWERVQPYLRSPVKKRIYLEHGGLSEGVMAGLSALSECSMLAAPKREVRAISSQSWQQVQKYEAIRVLPDVSRDYSKLELEIWMYAPELLSRNNCVDPLSLYLSLSNEKDERIEEALEELIGGIPW